MGEVSIRTENVIIPTYEVGAPEKIPMFIDRRVYQGSSGKVYPYPTIERISNEKKDKTWEAVILENDYLYVMILPALGGRIQRAYDKTNGYDFVYYNHVIKPALVGLLGPWISGGIEFNWPQHHRPTTYMPVDYKIVEGEDGSKSVLLHDVDRMYGSKVLTKITLHPDRAYIEITGQLYNRTPLPQTFLWWANPAVAVNENTQSVFPPDVHAVMDHGKRDVSRFPIATGVYYKKDYSEGVDISRYKNIPVPTSYMAEKSDYDFVGGYDYGREAGILHVADHHISPGKKQWTWGCGDFGKAWDRNLTDEDGPYVELMTGVYTDNQPDFTWLKPFEEKVFTQYFMPYKKLGQVMNACTDCALHLSVHNGEVTVRVYASCPETLTVRLTEGDQLIFEEEKKLAPGQVFEKNAFSFQEDETKLCLTVLRDGRELISYTPEKEELRKLPSPAEAAADPETYLTNEELFLTGQHIEQYRHATYLPDPYYLEALKRDPGDIRVNNAYGLLLLRRGLFEEAKIYFKTALKRLTKRNPNPYNSEPYYNLGLAELLLGNDDAAYDAFFKATWSNEQQEMSFYYLAAIDARRGEFRRAYDLAMRGLYKNYRNVRLRGMIAYLLRKLGKTEEAEKQIEENLAVDAFDFVSISEKGRLGEEGKSGRLSKEAAERMSLNQERFLMTARDYAVFGAYEEALSVCAACPREERGPMVYYYAAYYTGKLGREEQAKQLLSRAESADEAYCFPNCLEDIAVLRYAIEKNGPGMASYYLGCLYYDKLQFDTAAALFEDAKRVHPEFPTVYRNLALYYYNKKGDKDRALENMDKAFALDSADARMFLEWDQLMKKLGRSFEERLQAYEENAAILEERDDLYPEYITLLNMNGRYQEALDKMLRHHFHPWEGGEGKITQQYTVSLLHQAKVKLESGDGEGAEKLLREALVYPENLGEGKLEGTKDNHLYYHLGLALELQGKDAEAQEMFERATIGTDEPAGMMYYNDQPADMILYQGLSFLKLHKTREAKSRFYRLIDYGETHLNDKMRIEYFAVSLPDFLIFDDDLTVRNHAHCCYLMALGRYGLGEKEKAAAFLEEALEYEPSHMMCHLYRKDFA